MDRGPLLVAAGGAVSPKPRGASESMEGAGSPGEVEPRIRGAGGGVAGTACRRSQSRAQDAAPASADGLSGQMDFRTNALPLITASGRSLRSLTSPELLTWRAVLRPLAGTLWGPAGLGAGGACRVWPFLEEEGGPSG